jgi:hypothetical protein
MYLSMCLSCFAVWARWVLYASIYASTALCLLLESIHLPPSIYYWSILGAAYQSIRLSACLSIYTSVWEACSEEAIYLHPYQLWNSWCTLSFSCYIYIYICIYIYPSIHLFVRESHKKTVSVHEPWALSRAEPLPWALGPESWACIFVFIVN